VDKALLDRPHIIKNIELQLTKGSRKGRFEPFTPAKTTEAAWNNNNTSAAPKKSNMKQATIGMSTFFTCFVCFCRLISYLLLNFIDPEITVVNIPNKIYCIHIRNLPSNADAETLSIKFNWPMGNILMDSSTDNQSSSIECWLKGFNELQAARNFVQDWNEQIILGSEIDCDVEEDRLELCNKFRIGECPKTSEACDWEHIMCTANGRCSNDCLLGHKEGMKTGYKNDCKLPFSIEY
jgi:hypothetical protein